MRRYRVLIVSLVLAWAAPALAQAPQTQRVCVNPDAMAKFTLDCAKGTDTGVGACYEVAAKIYCRVEVIPAPAPQAVAEPKAEPKSEPKPEPKVEPAKDAKPAASARKAPAKASR